MESLQKQLFSSSSLEIFAARGAGYRGEQVCKFAHFSLFGGRAIFFRVEKKRSFFRVEKRYLGVFQHSNDSHRVRFRSRCCFSHEFSDFSSQKVLKNSVFSCFRVVRLNFRCLTRIKNFASFIGPQGRRSYDVHVGFASGVKRETVFRTYTNFFHIGSAPQARRWVGGVGGGWKSKLLLKMACF